jgi:hypothetical protein
MESFFLVILLVHCISFTIVGMFFPMLDSFWGNKNSESKYHQFQLLLKLKIIDGFLSSFSFFHIFENHSLYTKNLFFENFKNQQVNGIYLGS